MSDNRATIRRVERALERDWRAQFARLLPRVPAPTWTPGCTCEWMEERVLCVAEPIHVHVRYVADCPDHEPPGKLP